VTSAAPGVRIRKPGEPKPAKYRRKPEPQGPFHEEAADAELRLVDERKLIAIRARKRRR
jgi:hypothetical protein